MVNARLSSGSDGGEAPVGRDGFVVQCPVHRVSDAGAPAVVPFERQGCPEAQVVGMDLESRSPWLLAHPAARPGLFPGGTQQCFRS